MCRRSLKVKSGGTSRWVSHDCCLQYPICAKCITALQWTCTLWGALLLTASMARMHAFQHHTVCDHEACLPLSRWVASCQTQ